MYAAVLSAWNVKKENTCKFSVDETLRQLLRSATALSAVIQRLHGAGAPTCKSRRRVLTLATFLHEDTRVLRRFKAYWVQ
jgi:hypothetical protein